MPQGFRKERNEIIGKSTMKIIDEGKRAGFIEVQRQKKPGTAVSLTSGCPFAGALRGYASKPMTGTLNILSPESDGSGGEG